MQCEQLKERLADSWANALSERDRAALDAHLAECSECRQEAAMLGETWQALGALPDEQPSPALERRFTAMLDAWHAAAQSRGGSGRTEQAAPRRGAWAEWWGARPWQPAWQPALQLAAALLLVVAGFAAGRGWPDEQASREMGELRGEVRSMREMVALALLQQDSAVERLRGVSWSHQIDSPGREVLSALLDTLAHDANVNVRLAAIDTLRVFAADERVRTGLVGALGKQREPLVQIALIDAMVELRERRSVEMLRTLAGSDATNDAVRQRARRGLQQLS